MQTDLMPVRRAVEKRLRQRLQLVVGLARVDDAVLVEPRSHAKRRVTRESADLQYVARTEHLYQQFEQLALNMSRHHPRIQNLQMRLAIEFRKQRIFGRGVRTDVFFERIHIVFS